MNRKSNKSVFTVPVNSTKSGHMVFLSDAAWLTILSDPSMSELAHVSFEIVPPRVRVEKDAIVIEYRDLSTLKKREDTQTPVGSITLNSSIPWEVEFRGRTSNLTANVRGLELQSLDLLGGASQAELSLPKPINTTFIYVPGGIEDSVIHMPAGVGIRLRVNGPVKQLFFDKRLINVSGEKFGRENATFKTADSHYDICITGGVSNVTIDE